jgi:hypothetical protein
MQRKNVRSAGVREGEMIYNLKYCGRVRLIDSFEQMGE